MMTTSQIVLSLVLSLIANEICDVSPRIGKRLVCLAARMKYPAGERRQIRTEELVALIEERPGKLFKLTTSMLFVVAAIPSLERRTNPPRWITAMDRRMDKHADRMLDFTLAVTLGVLSVHVLKAIAGSLPSDMLIPVWLFQILMVGYVVFLGFTTARMCRRNGRRAKVGRHETGRVIGRSSPR
jgi:hypothetical protein